MVRGSPLMHSGSVALECVLVDLTCWAYVGAYVEPFRGCVGCTSIMLVMWSFCGVPCRHFGGLWAYVGHFGHVPSMVLKVLRVLLLVVAGRSFLDFRGELAQATQGILTNFELHAHREKEARVKKCK